MIKVVLPHHLRTLAKVGDEVHLHLNGTATVKSLLDALEQEYPVLRGTIRDHETLKRRRIKIMQGLNVSAHDQLLTTDRTDQDGLL